MCGYSIGCAPIAATADPPTSPIVASSRYLPTLTPAGGCTLNLTVCASSSRVKETGARSGVTFQPSGARSATSLDADPLTRFVTVTRTSRARTVGPRPTIAISGIDRDPERRNDLQLHPLLAAEDVPLVPVLDGPVDRDRLPRQSRASATLETASARTGHRTATSGSRSYRSASARRFQCTPVGVASRGTFAPVAHVWTAREHARRRADTPLRRNLRSGSPESRPAWHRGSPQSAVTLTACPGTTTPSSASTSSAAAARARARRANCRSFWASRKSISTPRRRVEPAEQFRRGAPGRPQAPQSVGAMVPSSLPSSKAAWAVFT